MSMTQEEAEQLRSELAHRLSRYNEKVLDAWDEWERCAEMLPALEQSKEGMRDLLTNVDQYDGMLRHLDAATCLVRVEHAVLTDSDDVHQSIDFLRRTCVRKPDPVNEALQKAVHKLRAASQKSREELAKSKEEITRARKRLQALKRR